MAVEISTLVVTVKSDGIEDTTKGLQVLTAAAEAAESKSVVLKKATDATTTSQKSATSAIEAQLEKLKTQAALVGASNEKMATYKLTSMGASQSQIDLASSLGRQIDALKAHNAAMSAAHSEALKMNKEFDESSGIMNKLGLATVGAKREVMVLAHEMISGNFSRIPGSVLVLGERMSAMEKIISAVFSATGIAILGALAAFGLYITAVVKGAQEQKAMNDALILTGNYAGTTSDGILQMARSVSGNVTVAKKAMTELAASGQSTSSQILLIGDAATKMHDTFGIEVDKTIKQFEEITKKPAEAILALNDHYHFLTASVYDQILALEKEGNVQEAARLGIEAYGRTLEERTKIANDNLGFIAKLWKTIKEETQGAIDKALEWNKKSTPQTRLDAAQSRLDMFNRGSNTGPAIEAERARLLRDVADAQEQVSRAGLRASEVGIQQRIVADALHAATKLAIEDDKGKQKSALAKALAENAVYEEAIRQKDLQSGEHSGAITEEAIAERRAYTIKKHTEAVKAGSDDRLKILQDAIIKEKIIFDREKSTYDDRIVMLDTYHTKLGLSDQEFFAGKEAARKEYIDSEQKLYEAELKSIQNFAAKYPKEVAERTRKEDALLKQHLEFLDKMHKADVEDAVSRESIRHKLDEDEQKAADKTVEAINKQIEAIQNKVDANSKLPSAIEAVMIAELEEQEAFLKGSGFEDEAMKLKIKNIEAEIEARKRLHSVQLGKEQEDAETKAAKKYQEAYNTANKSIADGLYNAISEGGGSAIKKLVKDIKNWFARLVLEPIISPISNFGASIVAGMGGQGGVGGSLSGIANTGSSLNSLSSLFGFGQKEAGLSFSGGASALSAGGTAFSDAAFTASQAAGTGVMSSISSMAASAAPIIGAALLAKTVFDHFNGGETRSGGQYGYKFDNQDLFNNRRDAPVSNATSGVNFLEGPSGGQIESGQVTNLISSTVASINNLLKQVGSSASLTGFQAGLESSDEGRGGVFAGGKLSSGATFGMSGAGDNYNGTLFDSKFSTSPDAKTALLNFSTELKQTAIQALQAATDIPQAIKTQLQSVDVKNLTDEAATSLLTSITTEITGVNDLRSSLDKLPFPNLSSLSFEAADSLIKFSGGIQNLQSQLTSYYNNFYTDAERAAKETENVQKALSTLGYTGITTKAQFRQIVDSLDLTTENGQKTYAALMGIQGAFAQVADTTAQATQSINQSWQNFWHTSASTATNTLKSSTTAVDSFNSTIASAFQSLINEAKKFAKDMSDLSNSLLTDNTTTPLKAIDQYDELKRKLETYAGVLDGSITQGHGKNRTALPVSYDDAQAGIKDVVAQFLSSSKGVFGMGHDYNVDFDTVQELLRNISSNSLLRAQEARADAVSYFGSSGSIQTSEAKNLRALHDIREQLRDHGKHLEEIKGHTKTNHEHTEKLIDPTLKTAKILVRVTRDGESLVTEAA